MAGDVLSQVVVPDAIEPVIGWRAWLVTRETEGVRLRSTVFPDHVWEPRSPVTAFCRRMDGRHPVTEAPGVKCLCGVHASSKPATAKSYMHTIYAKQADVRYDVVWGALGKVRLWGRVVEHERGWRGQFAYPEQIALPGVFLERDVSVLPDIADELREAYGVSVLIVYPKRLDVRSFARRLKGTESA